MNSHIGHVKDLPQGFITAVIHLHQVCSSEAVVVLMLGYLLGQMENLLQNQLYCPPGPNSMLRSHPKLCSLLPISVLKLLLD